MKRDFRVFYASVFFVLGFAFVFSILGVLLQTLLAGIAHSVQVWLSRIGGLLIILFGIYLLDIVRIGFLEREHKFHITKKFKSMPLTSFVFGAVFAVGWTPCIGPVLGAILTLAVTTPSIAFLLLLSYSLGLGLPFLLVGLFTNEAQKFIKVNGKWLRYFRYVFGAFLIIIGILVFTNNLSLLANFSGLSAFVLKLNSSGFGFGTNLNLFVAFGAGLVSFLSPCVLPLMPAFLTYLASIGIKNKK
jgi:cytochrome c-type biogenesis protein